MKEITDAKALMDMQAIINAQQAAAAPPPAVRRFVRRRVPMRGLGRRRGNILDFGLPDHNCPAKVSGTSGIYWKILVFRSVISAPRFQLAGSNSGCRRRSSPGSQDDKCTRASSCLHN